MNAVILKAIDEVVDDLKKLSNEALIEKLKVQSYGSVSYAAFDAVEFVMNHFLEYSGLYKKVDKAEIEKELLDKLYSEYEFIFRLDELSKAANDNHYLMAA